MECTANIGYGVILSRAEINAIFDADLYQKYGDYIYPLNDTGFESSCFVGQVVESTVNAQPISKKAYAQTSKCHSLFKEVLGEDFEPTMTLFCQVKE